MHVYLKTYLYKNYTAKSTFYAKLRSVGIFEIFFTVQKISIKAFNFFNSAWSQCEAFLNQKTTFMSSKHCRMGCGEDKSLLFFCCGKPRYKAILLC